MSAVWVPETQIEIFAAPDEQGENRLIAIKLNGQPCLLLPMQAGALSDQVEQKFQTATSQICLDGPQNES